MADNQFSRKKNRPRPTTAREVLQPAAPKTHKKLTVLIDRQLHHRLQGQAWREQRTMTAIVSEVLAKYLDDHTG